MYSDKELDDFTDEQIKILKDATAKIDSNALDFHRKHCNSTDSKCDQFFMEMFLMFFTQKIKMLQKDKGSLRIEEL